jgi:hypothetical protein
MFFGVELGFIPDRRATAQPTVLANLEGPR